MRPYLAVFKDSFREALASRVLWILLILTTVLLLAVAPLAIKDHRPTRLNANSVFDWAGLITKLKDQAAGSENSPGKHLWTLFASDVKRQLEALPENAGTDPVPPELTGAIVAELNRLLSERLMYDAAAWQGIEIGEEATRFVHRGTDRLSDEELARLNRMLLESAFPEEIARSTKSEIYLAYFGWKLGEPLSMSRSQVTPLLKTILAGVMNFFVGTLAVFAAILVTSPVIPHTFEAGAIDLLFSKPVSRPLVFLAKYVGGCVFILLNGAYFVGGLWLIVGLRFDLWSGKLLLCIPIFMFLFAIYYSVSAFAGVLWKNAIVSIVITVLFWAACFVVGTTKNVIEQLFLKPQRLARLVPAGESLFALNDQGKVLLWQESDRRWAAVLQSDEASDAVGPMMVAPPILGPAYDSLNDQILAIKMPWPAGFRLAAPEATLLVGARRDQWARGSAASLPRDPIELLTNARDRSVLVVTKQTVYRLEGDATAKPREFKMLGLRVPLGAARGPFVVVGPEPPLRLTLPAAAAVNADSGALAVWNRGTLQVLDRDDSGKYQRVLEKEFQGDAKPAVLAFAGSTVVMAQADGRIRIVDARNGAVAHEFRPEGKNQPRSVAADPTGRWFIVVFHHYKTWLWDAQQETAVAPAFVGKSDISAATFAGPNRLMLADRGTRVTDYELPSFRAVGQHVPEMGILERVYRYAVLPIYTVFPKPGELDNMVAYLLTEQETAAVGPDAENLAAAQVKLNVKGPVWSSLAFMLVMLALTCSYIRRADF
jgi:hypothetical protein